jgi:hypothetical protein
LVVFVADNKTGEVFVFPLGGEENYSLGIAFQRDSRMLFANWITGVGGDAKCMQQYFEWNKSQAKLIATETLPSQKDCWSETWLNVPLASLRGDKAGTMNKWYSLNQECRGDAFGDQEETKIAWRRDPRGQVGDRAQDVNL